MLQTSARLLRLLTLLQARPTWSGEDLADKLEITGRTLRRDVDRLRSLGYPVDSATGAAGGYRLGAGASLPPLHLDEDEATAVFIGLHSAAGGGVAGVDVASASALGKLESVFPPRLKRRLSVLRSSVLKLADRAPAVSLSAVSTIAVACSDRRVLEFSYAAGASPGADRTVEPLRIVRAGPRWYLVAWDLARAAWRTFRLDRIRAPRCSGRSFKARSPPHDDLERYVTESLSSSPYPYRARVVLHAPVGQVRARVTAFDGVLEARGSGQCVLSTGARSLDTLAVHLALLDVDFEILEPASLASRVRSLGTRLVRASRRGRGPARKGPCPEGLRSSS